MTPGDVWAFEAAGAAAYFRAVMPVRKLGLDARSPLSFAGQAWLLQVSALATIDDAFAAGNLLLDGCLLVGIGSLRRLGFARVGTLAVDLAAVDWPWFMADDSGQGLLVCHGELSRSSPGLTRERFHAWDIRLTLMNPSSLRARVEAHRKAKGVGPSAYVDATVGDIRYSPYRRAVVDALGIDLDASYLEAVLASGDPSRVTAYRHAVVGKSRDRPTKG